MKKHRISVLVLSALLCSAVNAEVDYTKGVFIVNEDWYGHHNSTVNHLNPEASDGAYWTYRAFQKENPGCELGCTTQFAAVFNNRIYFISKQAKDPGSTVTGGRITVADAKTLSVLAQIEKIDDSGAMCDGRAFLGIDSRKGYVSSSNGIWIMDLESMSVLRCIPGTGNPNAGDNSLPSIKPGSALYHGQTGTMVLSADRVFAAHQSSGILVIDPTDDSLETTVSIAKVLIDSNLWQPTVEDLEDIEAGYASLEECAPGVGAVITDRSGTVWASLSANINGTGESFPVVLKINPYSLDVTPISIPADIQAPASSWYAWTPDTFSSSPLLDEIYWRGGDRWFGGDIIWKYNYTSHTFGKLIDTGEDGNNWHIYGCSMRPHPESGEIYCSLYHDNQSTAYITRRYSNDGKIIAEYPMIENYWFPSLPVFPEQQSGNIAVLPDNAEEDNIQYFSIQGIYFGSEKPEKAGIYIEKRGQQFKKIIIR